MKSSLTEGSFNETKSTGQPKLESAVSGTVRRRSSIKRKLFNIFVPDDIEDTKNKIADTVITGLKYGIVDCISMWILGEPAGYTKNLGKKVKNSITSYDCCFGNKSQTQKKRMDESLEDYKDILVDYEDAMKAKAELLSYGAKYPIVTVANVWEVLGQNYINQRLTQYGWENLDTVYIEGNRRDGYWINIPYRPIPLDIP